jgi:hypothetical protein
VYEEGNIEGGGGVRAFVRVCMKKGGGLYHFFVSNTLMHTKRNITVFVEFLMGE